MTELPDWWPNPRGSSYLYSAAEIELVRGACDRSVSDGRRLATDIGERDRGQDSRISGNKCGTERDGVRFGHVWGPRSHICMDCGVREGDTHTYRFYADGRDSPDRVLKTSPRTILSIQALHIPNAKQYAPQEILFIATTDGVYERGDDGVFRECVFERRGESDV